MLNVHLVSHTHDDVGWLQTVDQYYYTRVQYILDSVVAELTSNPTRRFTYVEMAFFYRWWREQPDDVRATVRQLVSQGRLTFTLGGWCMADEATTHYTSLIDAHSLGLHFLEREFGACGRPLAAWQVDPFGHSREFAHLFAMLGYDSYFLWRLDYQDIALRIRNREMEFVWRTADAAADAARDLFTGVLYPPGNWPPSSFLWEQFSGDPPMMDDPELDDYNVDQRVDAFLDIVRDHAQHYRTSQVMVILGSDFMYQNAYTWYTNLDKLIKYINLRQANGSRVNAFYSTPDCYAYAINRERPAGWSLKTDDVLPYASDARTFWTGFYTSRAGLKGYERTANAFLQAASQLNALAGAGLDAFGDGNLFLLREAMGIVQHHDGISGTETQAVAYDYAKRVAVGVAKAQDVVNAAYGRILAAAGQRANATANLSAPPPPTQQFCWLLNETICLFTTDPSTSQRFSVTLYNPVSHAVSQWVRVPLESAAYRVLDASRSISVTFVPVNPLTRSLWRSNAYNASLTRARVEAVFQATDVPALGSKTYSFVRTSAGAARAPASAAAATGSMRTRGYRSRGFATQRQRFSGPSIVKQRQVRVGSRGSFVIENEALALTFDKLSGRLASVRQKELGVELPVSQSLASYRAFQGDGPKSGAYLFRPRDNASFPLPVRKLMYFQGEKLSEVYQQFGDWAGQVIRLYKGAKHFEIEWTVGPINVSDGNGREVISLFETPLSTEGVFWTDSNSRQMLKRKRDKRESWNFTQTEPIAGNYYPITSRLFIRDEERGLQLTVLNDRAQGGSSIADGSLELMLHRRLLVDDGFGVGEPLNEPGISGNGLVVRGKHYVLLHSVQQSARLHRLLANALVYSPLISFAALAANPLRLGSQSNRAQFVFRRQASPKHVTWSGLTTDLPVNVQVVTLQQWDAGTLLIRLEHLFQPLEDAQFSQNVTIDLSTVFKEFRVINSTELILGGNMKIDDWQTSRLQWSSTADSGTSKHVHSLMQGNRIVLQPAELRTFRLHIASSDN